MRMGEGSQRIVLGNRSSFDGHRVVGWRLAPQKGHGASINQGVSSLLRYVPGGGSAPLAVARPSHWSCGADFLLFQRGVTWQTPKQKCLKQRYPKLRRRTAQARTDSWATASGS